MPAGEKNLLGIRYGHFILGVLVEMSVVIYRCNFIILVQNEQ